MILLLALACAPADAEQGSSLVVAEDIDVEWNDAYADADGAGSLFPLDALVLDPEGQPAEGVRVEITSGWGEAWLLPPGAARAADAAPCADDDACEGWYDIERPGWLEVRSEDSLFESAADPRHSYLSVATNEFGLAPFSVFVDTAPDTGPSIPIYVSILVETDSFEISVDDAVVDSP